MSGARATRDPALRDRLATAMFRSRRGSRTPGGDRLVPPQMMHGMRNMADALLDACDRVHLAVVPVDPAPRDTAPEVQP